MTGASARRRPFRILVLVHGTIGTHMSGPEIRGWQIAKALAARHTVTVADRGPNERLHDGVRVVPTTRGRLVREALAHDAVVGPSLPPYLLLALRHSKVAIISDQYDPVDLEVATLEGDPGIRREVASREAHLRLQLRAADMVMCAGERQRSRLSAMGQAGGDRAGAGIEILPMGIAPEAHESTRLLRDRFPAIAPDDRVILWWGSIWKWFDAETAIRAVGGLASEDPRIKLVITAGPPSYQRRTRMLAVDSARQLAASLGLLDRHVFFLDEWVPYEQRAAYLMDANVGISLHRGTAEAELAARARYMDYLWAGLPCVLAAGDETAQEFGERGFARLVAPGDEAATRQALLALLEDPQSSAARDAGRALAAAYRWDVLVGRWVPKLETLITGKHRGTGAWSRVAADVAAYYWRRTGDKGLAVARSMRTRMELHAS
jgi:glycosyltransferase involved in cell wall biosynthesis